MDDDGGGAGDDPFGSLLPFCHVSSSQEVRLRRCPFAPEPYNPENNSSSANSDSDDQIRVESTGIIMVSPPDSEEEGGEENDDSNSHDVFHTPPEESAAGSSNELQPPRDADGHGGYGGGGETAAVGVGFWEADGSGTVDLSRDSDLGFSEVELAQRVEPDWDPNRSRLDDSGTKLEGVRVLRRELSLQDGLGESPLKKLKVSRLNSEKADEESESERNTPRSNGSDLNENLGINSDESSAKRKLDFMENDGATEVVEMETEANDSVLGLGNAERRVVGYGEIDNSKDKLSAKEFLETMEMLQRHDSSGETQETAVDIERSPPRRRLPGSITRQSEKAAAAEDKGRRELTLLDVLKLIGEDCDGDLCNSSCSFLEMAKRRGMSFPRPELTTNFGEDDS
ncbi:hypothetical protein PanWU01x14_123360 [Parasponia andersonii]|uniref:Uncharacterized protein n=1 Tax=Parasponia andersonii TaxID=3476 RepID=A0A2P5CU95_PARAD|nr:hypothetical protein PanWU01x14_123360 [Parasponia andersonii]